MTSFGTLRRILIFISLEEITMKREVLEFEYKRKKRRAKELYSSDSPFFQKIEKNKKEYNRKQKHKQNYDKDY